MSSKTNAFTVESEALKTIIKGIAVPNMTFKSEAKKRIDSLVKPLGSLGKLEDIAAQIAAIQENLTPKITKKCTIVMSSDHGIVEEGIACAPAEITVLQTVNMLKNMTGICAISQSNGSDIKVVDIGIKTDVNYPGLVQRKVRYGTANFAKECAMTREDAEKALLIGIEMVKSLIDEGYDLFGTGEMGIGNTSCSSAVYMAFTGESADKAVGKGGGITEEALALKKKVIGDAVTMHQPMANDPIDVLSKVGGLDLAGMAGCFLGAAYYKKPIVIDGFISAAAALTAYRINPLVREYLIPSHMSLEPGYIHIMKEIGLEPMLHLNMRLGEGTGCPIAFSIIETALSMMNSMATFEQAMIQGEDLVDIR
jgi:nicotinate-nucleotide--dimethylbenzimidazole phosphoribosyltransferase